MPAVVRFAKLPADPTEDDELILAEREALQRALDGLDDSAAELETSEEAREAVRVTLQEELDRLDRDEEADEDSEEHEEEQADQEARLRLRLLAVRRDAVVELRDRREIDDVVLRRLQGRLDVEEIHLAEVERED
jgi:hypothetical protein